MQGHDTSEKAVAKSRDKTGANLRAATSFSGAVIAKIVRTVGEALTIQCGYIWRGNPPGATMRSGTGRRVGTNCRPGGQRPGSHGR